MTSEEEDAIEQIKEAQKRMTTPMFLKDVKYNNDDYSKAIDTILNLIEKQQREIEELKSKYKDLFFQNFDLWEKNIFPMKAIREEYISRDKIREIFQFYIERDSLFNDNPHKMAVIRLKDVLEELLEENEK